MDESKQRMTFVFMAHMDTGTQLVRLLADNGS